MPVIHLFRRAAAAIVMLLAMASAIPASAQFTILTEAQAHQAFRHMQHMQTTGEIEFRFVLDGCYARAHLMTERLRQLKIEPMKLWAVANDQNAPLQVQSKYLPINGGWVTWNYHVAPAVHVKLRNGQVRQWVFDPSIHWHSPLDADQWLAAMRPRNVRRTYTASSQYSVNGSLPHGGAVHHARYVMQVYRDRYRRRDFRALSPAEMSAIALYVEVRPSQALPTPAGLPLTRRDAELLALRQVRVAVEPAGCRTVLAA